MSAVYRHPDQTKIIDFIEEFSNFLSDSLAKKVFIISWEILILTYLEITVRIVLIYILIQF